MALRPDLAGGLPFRMVSIVWTNLGRYASKSTRSHSSLVRKPRLDFPRCQILFGLPAAGSSLSDGTP